MKKFTSLLLSLVMLISTVSAYSISSYADDIDYTTMSINGTWGQGYITDSTGVKWYKFTIPSDGTVTMKFMYYIEDVDFNFYNRDLSNKILGTTCWGGNSSSPKTEIFSADLSKGTYYIKISKWGNCTGKFKVNCSFNSFNANETEPNDYENAMQLNLAKEVTGAITYQDNVDWYRITLSANSKVNIRFVNYLEDVDFSMYNRDLSNKILSTTCWGGNSSSPKTETFSAELSKGTYYIKVLKWSNCTGKYKLSWDMNVKVSKPSKFKVSSRGTNSLKLSWSKVSGVTGYQLQRKSGDSYKTLKNTTSTSYTVSKLSAGTIYKFRVRAYKTVSGKKYYSSWTYLTTPTKPSKPSIKAPSTNKKHQIIVKWKKVSKCSGYQVQYSKKKNFSSVIATKTVSGSSKTSYTGKNFTKGKTYYVRVRSYKTVNGTKYYSAWSSVKSIKSK